METISKMDPRLRGDDEKGEGEQALKFGHQIFNLPGYVTHRLTLAGVKTVFDTKQDTLTTDSFFSNRRAFLKGEKGFVLQISVIGMG